MTVNMSSRTTVKNLIAALLDIDLKKAIVAELIGIVMATVIMSIVSYGLLGSLLS